MSFYVLPSFSFAVVDSVVPSSFIWGSCFSFFFGFFSFSSFAFRFISRLSSPKLNRLTFPQVPHETVTCDSLFAVERWGMKGRWKDWKMSRTLNSYGRRDSWNKEGRTILAECLLYLRVTDLEKKGINRWLGEKKLTLAKRVFVQSSA